MTFVKQMVIRRDFNRKNYLIKTWIIIRITKTVFLKRDKILTKQKTASMKYEKLQMVLF